MKKILFPILIFLTLLPAFLFAEDHTLPDTVKTGVYIISVHDIDFRAQEYTIRFWLWLRYNNPDFDFAKNVEVPLAKSIEKTDETTDTIDGHIFTLMKVKCEMKESWEVQHYPFDKQKLEIRIENAQFDKRYLIFAPDTIGEQCDPKLTISGWNISKINISTGLKSYETSFGDASLSRPHSEYGSYNVAIDIERNAWGLFFKLFLGMYVSFLIGYICFFIHGDSIDARFALSVGALFAAVGNKYLIDSLLPESSSFTLVDSLHAITFIAIFFITLLSMYSLKITKKGDMEQAAALDKTASRILLAVYFVLNIFYIIRALIG